MEQQQAKAVQNNPVANKGKSRKNVRQNGVPRPQGNNNASRFYYYGRQPYYDVYDMQSHGNFAYYPVSQNPRNRDQSIGEEKDLESKMLRVNQKRFYVDVKENKRGRFIKIAEVAMNNRKSRVLMSMSVGVELRDRLSDLVKLCEEQAAHDPDNHEQLTQKDEQSGRVMVKLPEKRISSETIIRDTRRYYLDLKENKRGRFLRITMMSNVMRAMITVPVEGIGDLRDLIADYVDRFTREEDLLAEGARSGRDDQGAAEADGGGGADPAAHVKKSASVVAASLKSASIRVNRHGMFYFDAAVDRRGECYLRVSDVRPTYRTSIAIPHQGWIRFRDIMQSYIDKLQLTATTELEDERQSDPTTAEASANNQSNEVNGK